MTRTELNKFQTVLNAKLNQATQTLGRREDLTMERTPDALDEVQLATTREVSTRNLERESGLLREVLAALGRIDDSSYGVCLQCQEEISQKRLKAVPWATFCIACQEQSDRSRQWEAAYHETSLRKAA